MKILLVLILFCCSVHAYDWPVFRGANRNSISLETDLNFGNISNQVLWSKDVGIAYSGVSIQNNCLYTLGNVDSNIVISCLNASTGTSIWQYSYLKTSKKSKFPGQRSTPTIAAGVCYSVDSDGVLIALDARTGKVKWRKNLVDEYGIKLNQWGVSSSVIVYKDLLIINAGEHGLAVNKKDGSKKWNSPVEAGSYSTVKLRPGKNPEVLVFGPKAIFGVMPETGKVNWKFDWPTGYGTNAADPVLVGDKILISSAYNQGSALLAIKDNQVTNLWKSKNLAAHFSTPIHFNDCLIGSSGSSNKGQLECLNPQTGKLNWSQKIGFGSPLIADNKLVYLNQKGKIFIAEVSEKGYKELFSKQIFKVKATKCWTMPVICNGKMYCRHDNQLICMDLK